MVARRAVLGGIGATALTGAFAPAAATVGGGGRRSRVGGDLQATYAGLFEAALASSPETATLEGLDTGGRAALKRRLDDRSLGARLNIYAPLVALGPTLAGEPLPGDAREHQWLQTFRWYAEQAERMRSVAGLTVNGYGYPIPYAVTQLSGAYVEVPDLLANQHVIADAADCEAYLDRLAALPRVIDQGTDTGRVQADGGVIPPDFVCDATLTQLRDLAAGRGAQAELVKGLVTRASAARIGGDWQRRAVALVDGPVAAALGRQIAHMEALRRRAQPTAGVGARPRGDRLYAVALGFHTSTVMTPLEVHRTGLEQVASLQAEADALMATLGLGSGPVVARMNALAKDPDQLFPDTDAGRAALLAFVQDRLAEVMRRLPQAFDHLPRTPLAIRRTPVETQQGAPLALNQPGSADGTRPGLVSINLATTANWPKWQLPTTVYHEGVPGHHLQGSLATEAGGTPDLLKVLQANAYNEGWAVYAEQLADELGVYDDMPIGELGRLQASLWRACRLVADTGIHAFGWSRDRAIAYMVDQGGLTPDNARREVERYVVWPGQACSYKIGQLEFLRQREAARARMGTRFSLKAFHDAVLLGGDMPLAVMAGLLRQTMV